jgi:hypothetical protein
VFRRGLSTSPVAGCEGNLSPWREVFCFEGRPHRPFEVEAALTEGRCRIVEQALGDADHQEGAERSDALDSSGDFDPTAVSWVGSSRPRVRGVVRLRAGVPERGCVSDSG